MSVLLQTNGKDLLKDREKDGLSFLTVTGDFITWSMEGEKYILIITVSIILVICN